MTKGDFLSPRDLAAAIGVSESSLKRWVDGGELAAVRTPGGHRRIIRQEAIRFIRATGTPIVRPEPLGFAPAKVAPDRVTAGAEADVLFAAVESDDSAAFEAVLSARFLAGESIAALCDGLLRTVLHRVGALWRHGPEGIVIEHRAVDTAVRALALLRAALPAPAPRAPSAVGAALAGDPYVLPSLMAATVLAEVGFRAFNLGADTPRAALDVAVERYRPRLIWIAFQPSSELEPAQKAIQAIAARHARGAVHVVCGGGPAARAATPARSGLHALGSMGELQAFARALYAPQPGP